MKGDFSCAVDLDNDNFGKYVATGSHKVILSGDREQEVNNESHWLGFNELEIQNENGVKINGMVPIEKMRGKYKFIDEAMLIIGSIIGDVEIDGDLIIMDQEVDLAGYTLTINGDLDQISVGIRSGIETCKIKVNGGSLIVKGDYRIGDKKLSEDFLYKYYIEEAGEAVLEMTNENDYVYVGGNFITCSGENVIGVVDYYLTAGVMEVKGDFSCAVDLDNDNFGKYVATGSHKVILSGDREQEVNNESGWLIFNELEIQNENGVKFTWFTPVNLMKGNYKVIGDAYFIIGKVVGDVVIDGNLSIVDQEVDLEGYSFTVNGDLHQYFTENISGIEACKIKINGGNLIVNGNYVIGYNSESEEWGCDENSILEMTNEDDYVYVGGDFTMASIVDHSDYLTAGTLEVKGNFTQSGSPLNFVASENHKTILSGDMVQNVYFEYPETSYFNILKLTKPLDTGYIFNTTPVWKILEE